MKWDQPDSSLFNKTYGGRLKEDEAWCQRCQTLDHSGKDCPFASRARQGQGEAENYQPKRVTARSEAVCDKYNQYGGIAGMEQTADSGTSASGARAHTQSQDARHTPLVETRGATAKTCDHWRRMSSPEQNHVSVYGEWPRCCIHVMCNLSLFCHIM